MAVVDRLRAVRIKADLIADRRLRLMEIDVDVHGGTAVLTGDVTSEEEKQAAEDLAYETEGVHEVENDIRVVPMNYEDLLIQQITDTHMGYGRVEGDASVTAYDIAGKPAPPGPGIAASEQFPDQFSDNEINEEVRRRLASQTDMDVSNINFNSTNQIVYLSGKVKTNDELNHLQDMVLNLRGVMGVSSDVAVEEENTGTPVE